MFHIANNDEIKNGRVTDVYFARTLDILKAKGVDKRVRAEFFAKDLPGGAQWGVLAGIEEVAHLMEGRGVTIRAFREGSIFNAWEPVMEVEGPYQEFCVFETALLGLICQASGVATKAARVRICAGDKVVVSFGARRMHPAVAPMIERAAFIGGCDGVAVVASAELLSIDPMGTMPHSLVLLLGDTVSAVKAFDEVVDKGVKRVALIDTFNDEKFEAVRVAQAMGAALYGLRLDTPATRRGDFRRIFEEVRWELDLRGHENVRLFASGGLDEKEVSHLRPVVDAFGVGTAISNAPVVDFAMDIVEIDGRPSAKRGKWSGAKDVVVCESCGGRKTVPLGAGAGHRCACTGTYESLFVEIIKDGRVASALPRPDEIRRGVLSSLKGLAL